MVPVTKPKRARQIIGFVNWRVCSSPGEFTEPTNPLTLVAPSGLVRADMSGSLGAATAWTDTRGQASPFRKQRQWRLVLEEQRYISELQAGYASTRALSVMSEKNKKTRCAIAVHLVRDRRSSDIGILLVSQ